jgi:hypothetical protein
MSMKLIYVKDYGVFGIISRKVDEELILAKWYIDGFLHLEYLEEDEYIDYGDLLE